MNQLLCPTISKQDRRHYQSLGYLLPQNPLFPDAQFTKLQLRFEELLAENGVENLDVPHFKNPDLLEYLLADEVLNVVEALIGPDFGLWSSHFICKEPGIGRATPWHEDSAYWHGRFDNFDNIVTLWLAIDPSTLENGCMQVIPGSHLEDSGSYKSVDISKNIFGEELEHVDEKSAVAFELKPNHFSLHDSRIIHGAQANKSSLRRCGYTMRYFSQQMRFNQENLSNRTHHIWHCRGKNPHHNPVE